MKIDVVMFLVSMMVFSPLLYAIEVDSHPRLISAIHELVSENGMDQKKIYAWLNDAMIDYDVIRLIATPFERVPWYRYRERFITPTSIRSGTRFFSRNLKVLEKAENEFGVPAEIIVAIIGIETRYGTVVGQRRVLDSLTTLAVTSSRRSKFFLNELKEFLILSNQGVLNPLDVKGSYAGAIGIPQFMPSSYRHYAIDFDNDGLIDLIGSESDAIGSVGRYLNVHGWAAKEPTVEFLQKADFSLIQDYHTRDFKADILLEDLLRKGVRLTTDQISGGKVGVVHLDEIDGVDIRVTYPNFFVLTRYNRSRNYAMTVFELASELLEQGLRD